MKLLDQLKKSIADTTAERSAIQAKIDTCRADIARLESTPLPQGDALNILSSMVDKAAERHRALLLNGPLEEVSGNAEVSGLRWRIDEKAVLNPLFYPPGLDGDATNNVDAWCYFFGDIIKAKFAELCGGLAPVASDADCGSPFAQRIEEIDAKNATLKALELEEEDVAAAMDEARVQFESLPGL